LPANVRFETKMGETPLYAQVDPGQMENALLNLALNAKSAIDAGGPDEGVIQLRVEPVDLCVETAARYGLNTGRYIELSCTDNGAGMTTAVQKQIFDPFFSTRGEAGGTGLGLSMAQSFVEVSDGNISVNSEVGHGTTFKILIPRVDKQPTTQLPLATELPVSFDGQLALLVDDQEEVRNVLRRDLMALGFSVLDAESADEALGLLETVEGLDLVLSDISMPGQLNGMDLAHHILARFRQTSVVLMTGHAQLPRGGSEKSFSFPILSRPFEQHRLIEAIQHAQISRGGIVQEN
jgi:CheY-like chemotaxis protein